jgi:hypothetical protein
MLAKRDEPLIAGELSLGRRLVRPAVESKPAARREAVRHQLLSWVGGFSVDPTTGSPVSQGLEAALPADCGLRTA